MKALMIIDMQAGSFSRATPRFDAENVVKRINRLSDEFRNLEYAILFIQHDGSREKAFIPGSDEWQLLPMLNLQPSDLIISKTANDAFYKSELDDKLKSLQVRDVYITGCATDFCVDATVRSALAHDYNVVVIEDGHTTAKRPQLSAEEVINHHNWLWENMIPTGGSIAVLSTQQVLKNLSE